MKAPELAEAIRLYLEARGLIVSGDTSVTLRDDGGEGLRAEITNVSLGEIVRQPAHRPVPESRVARGPVAQDPVKDDPEPEPAPAPRTAPSRPGERRVSMPDASDWEEGQLDPTTTVAIPVSRFKVDPVPPGDPPTRANLGRVSERIRPPPEDATVPEQFRTAPVDHSQDEHPPTALMERGSLSGMPDDF